MSAGNSRNSAESSSSHARGRPSPSNSTDFANKLITDGLHPLPAPSRTSHHSGNSVADIGGSQKWSTNEEVVRNGQMLQIQNPKLEALTPAKNPGTNYVSSADDNVVVTSYTHRPESSEVVKPSETHPRTNDVCDGEEVNATYERLPANCSKTLIVLQPPRRSQRAAGSNDPDGYADNVALVSSVHPPESQTETFEVLTASELRGYTQLINVGDNHVVTVMHAHIQEDRPEEVTPSENSPSTNHITDANEEVPGSCAHTGKYIVLPPPRRADIANSPRDSDHDDVHYSNSILQDLSVFNSPHLSEPQLETFEELTPFEIRLITNQVIEAINDADDIRNSPPESRSEAFALSTEKQEAGTSKNEINVVDDDEVAVTFVPLPENRSDAFVLLPPPKRTQTTNALSGKNRIVLSPPRRNPTTNHLSDDEGAGTNENPSKTNIILPPPRRVPITNDYEGAGTNENLSKTNIVLPPPRRVPSTNDLSIDEGADTNDNPSDTCTLLPSPRRIQITNAVNYDGTDYYYDADDASIDYADYEAIDVPVNLPAPIILPKPQRRGLSGNDSPQSNQSSDVVPHNHA